MRPTEGKRYLMRNGKKTGPLEDESGFLIDSYCVSPYVYECIDGGDLVFANPNHEYDLVEELPDD